MHFHANPHGVVADHHVDLEDSRTYDSLRAWASDLNGHGVDKVEPTEGKLGFRVNGHAPFLIDLHGHQPTDSLGGNTFNTWNAMVRVVGSLDPEHLEDLPLHAIDTPRLRREIDAQTEGHDSLAWPMPPVILEIVQGARIRCNHVFRAPNGQDPLYVQRTPRPLATGKLPNFPWVFLSSSGSDVYQEILAHRERMESSGQTPYLHLAPGSAQVRRGIPEEVLKGVHFLSCNRGEALQLVRHFDANFSDTTPPQELTDFFAGLGVQEVRITDGANGVYACSNRVHTTVPSLGRDDRSLRAFVRRHHVSDPTSSTWDNPDLTGCGDTRLGTELALRHLRIGDPEQQLLIANTVAALQTFNPESNIANFPPDLIRDVVERVIDGHVKTPRQLARSA